jgi:hypothetical protein
MGALREKMIEEMKLRNFASRTQKSYLAVMVGLAKHYRQFPDQLTQEGGKPVQFIISRAIFERDVLPFNKSKFSKPVQENFLEPRTSIGSTAFEPANLKGLWLLLRLDVSAKHEEEGTKHNANAALTDS